MTDNDATQTRQDDATDELTDMLKARGVEHGWMHRLGIKILWTDANGNTASAVNWGDRLLVSALLTPQQAVDVTLGDSDATRARQDGAIDDALIQIADWHHDHLSEHAEECETDEYGGLYWVIGRDVSDDLDNLIIKAQNLAATLGVESDTSEYERNVDGSYKCPTCGCVVDYDIRGDDERIITMDDYVIPFNFCPKCGAEVVYE